MRRAVFFLSIVAVLLAACSGGGSSAGVPSTGPLNVVATTTLVADVVTAVGGDLVAVETLVPAGVDEHGYEPTPQDVVKVSRAKLVLLNGAGLEGFLAKLIENAGGNVPLVEVSEGITLLAGPDEHADEAHPVDEENAEDEHEAGDPHVWTDPNNVLVWVDNIERALSGADPQNAAVYRANAEAYRAELKALDAWITEQVAQIPAERRKLVTDHTVFTYFAARYGFSELGGITPGYSTMAAPSAQELAALEDEIRAVGVPAIFVGNTVNPALAERVAQDTGTRLLPILTGSLTAADGPGPTYLAYMRYNVTQIVEGLK